MEALCTLPWAGTQHTALPRQHCGLHSSPRTSALGLGGGDGGDTTQPNPTESSTWEREGRWDHSTQTPRLQPIRRGGGNGLLSQHSSQPRCHTDVTPTFPIGAEFLPGSLSLFPHQPCSLLVLLSCTKHSPHAWAAGTLCAPHGQLSAKHPPLLR